jgi:predicted RecA/RadA family phage recombinase
MALNKYSEGKVLDYTNASGVDIASGDTVLIGTLLGVALVNIPDGETGSVAIEGVFEIRKATGAITQGANLYWDADGNPVEGASQTGALTTTSSGNTLGGRAFAAAAEADATVLTKLNA